MHCRSGDPFWANTFSRLSDPAAAQRCASGLVYNRCKSVHIGVNAPKIHLIFTWRASEDCILGTFSFVPCAVAMTLARQPLRPISQAQFTNPVRLSGPVYCDCECTAIDHHRDTCAAVGSVGSAEAFFSTLSSGESHATGLGGRSRIESREVSSTAKKRRHHRISEKKFGTLVTYIADSCDHECFPPPANPWIQLPSRRPVVP